MHAFTNDSNYSSNNFMRESTILHKYIDVHKIVEVGSSWENNSNNKCIEANNTANTQLLFLLRKHTCTPLSLHSSVFSKYLQVEPEAILSISLQMGFYPRRTELKNRTLLPSLSRLFKLNYNLRQTKQSMMKNVSVTNKQPTVWSPRKESWSAITPTGANKLWLIKTNKPRICHSIWPTHQIAGIPRCSCIKLPSLKLFMAPVHELPSCYFSVGLQ